MKVVRWTGRLWGRASKDRSGGNCVLQVGVAQLEHPLGSGQVLQPMHPQVAQARAVGQGVGHELAGRLRHHRLAAMGQVAEPGGADDGRADVVALVPAHHIAGMHPEAQPQRRRR